MLIREDGDSATLYRSEKEALAYRIKTVLPVILDNNDWLYRHHYSLAKPIQSSSFNFKMDTQPFVEEADKLQHLTSSFIDRFNDVKDHFQYCEWEDLVLINKQCNALIKELGLVIDVKPLNEMVQNVNGKQSTDSIDYFKNFLKVEAINMVYTNMNQVRHVFYFWLLLLLFLCWFTVCCWLVCAC